VSHVAALLYLQFKPGTCEDAATLTLNEQELNGRTIGMETRFVNEILKILNNLVNPV